MTARMMHQTKMTILLSLNAVVILIVGVMIFSAINLNGGIEFQVVSERSDVIAENLAASKGDGAVVRATGVIWRRRAIRAARSCRISCAAWR